MAFSETRSANAVSASLHYSSAKALEKWRGILRRTDTSDFSRRPEIARGSAVECAKALSAGDNKQQKALLDRTGDLLTRLGREGYAVGEELGEYLGSQFDTDIGSMADDTQPTSCSAYSATLLGSRSTTR